MPAISLVRLSESYPEAKQREKSAAWLLAFDGNQDGSLDASEVQGPEGYFRCDWLGDRMNVRRWRNLETILRDAGLVERRRPHACGVLVERPTGLPVTPEGRYPAERHILFFAKPFDRIFALNVEATPDKFLEILKPRSAQVTRSRGRIEVQLDSGGVIQFRLGRGGAIQEIHYLDAAGADSLLTRLDFLQIVRDAGAFERLFSKNPYLAEEREAWLRLYSPVFTSVETPTISLKKARDKKSWRQILLFPDLHGNEKRFCALYHMVAAQKLDWLAMEMFSQPMQSSLDDFLVQPENSDAFRAAKKKIQDHLAAFWNPYFKKIRDPDKSPYYRLLLLCRKRGLRVVALDAKAYYSTASQKLAPLTIATRNLLWAKAVPDKGRGIVFGGQAHFTANRKARVQDFLLEQNSKRSIHLLSFSEKHD